MRQNKKLTHLSLFSGIGGLDLAAEWAGMDNVGQCEIDDFAYRVLEKHFPKTPKWRDIRTLTKESFYERTGRRTTDIISGGFPCQPFSVSGKRKGKKDDRYLWDEMFRIIEELRPLWIVGENVVGILRMGIEEILSDLARIGYRGGVLSYPANAVGARFYGERVFIIAASDSDGRHKLDKKHAYRPDDEYQKMFAEWQARQNSIPMDSKEDVCKASGGFERNDDGLSAGVDRLRAIGNAVNPHQAYPIFKSIAEIEDENINSRNPEELK